MDNDNFCTMWYNLNKSRKGYLFKSKITGIIYRPHQLLCKYYPDGHQINMLIDGTHEDYEILDVYGWRDGMIVNPKEYFEKSV